MKVFRKRLKEDKSELANERKGWMSSDQWLIKIVKGENILNHSFTLSFYLYKKLCILSITVSEGHR